MLEKRSYEFLGDIFESEKELLNDFILSYMSSSTYICDAISECSDSNVPVYSNELYSKCWELNDFVEEANSQGLLEGVEIDLFRILSIGAYQYYTQVYYDNLENIIFNYAIEYIEIHCPQYLEEIEESDLEELIEDIDNNSMFCDIDCCIDSYIMEDLEEEEEEEEEGE